MGVGGRTCRKRDRRPGRTGEPLTVRLVRDTVRIELRGRLVRIVTGAAADAIRDALTSGDEAAVERLVARRTGSARRGT